MTENWAGCQGPKEKLFQQTNKTKQKIKPTHPVGVKFRGFLTPPQEALTPPNLFWQVITLQQTPPWLTSLSSSTSSAFSLKQMFLSPRNPRWGSSTFQGKKKKHPPNSYFAMTITGESQTIETFIFLQQL